MEIMKTLSLSFIAACLLSGAVSAAELKFTISNAEPNQGKLQVGLFVNEHAFEEGTYAHGLSLAVSAASVEGSFKDLPPGRYLLAVYQDKNGNEKLDKSFFGVPQELYGFSHYPSSGRPEFDEAAFELPATGSSVSIQLR